MARKDDTLTLASKDDPMPRNEPDAVLRGLSRVGHAQGVALPEGREPLSMDV